MCDESRAVYLLTPDEDGPLIDEEYGYFPEGYFIILV